MLENEDWIKLLNGLQNATENQKVAWEEVTDRTRTRSVTAVDAVLDAWNRDRTLVAMNRNTRYELSSAAQGRAPFELYVLEVTPRSTKTIGKVRSSSAVSQGDNRLINVLLEQLYQTATEGIESGGEVVDRLLGDLGL